MNHFYLDASAYLKLYYPERGSEIVNALIAALHGPQARRLIVTSMTIAESIAVLNRRRNELGIPDSEYGGVVARLLADVAQFTHWRILDDDLLSATLLIPDYNLNASDALHLHTAVRIDRLLAAARQDRVALIASDHRLLRAAAAEGLAVLDPEAASVRQVLELVHAD